MSAMTGVQTDIQQVHVLQACIVRTDIIRMQNVCLSRTSASHVNTMLSVDLEHTVTQ